MDKLTSMSNQTLEPTTMNTTCTQYTATAPTLPQARHIFATWLGLASTWWTRRNTQHPVQKTDNELTALDGLTPETLKDIGAPEWVQARAQRAQDRARQGGLFERESLHWR